MPRRGTKRRRRKVADDDKDDDVGVHDDDDESPSAGEAKASLPQPPRRRSPRRSPRRTPSSRVSYKEEDYDDDEEDTDEEEIIIGSEREEEKKKSAEELSEEEDEEDEASDRKKPRRKKSLTLRRRRKKPTKGDLTCPHCGKIFLVIQGLKYHVDNFVCRQELRPGGPVRKGRRTIPDGSAPKNKYKRLRGSLKDRTCPECKRVFTSTLGLNYHMEKKVCLQKASKSNKKLKIKPFDTLNAGEQFVTPYGIVEVVQDSCAVPTADLPTNLGEARKQWLKVKSKRDVQAQKQNAFATAVHRVKRARLVDLYEKDQIDQQTVFRAYFGKDPRKIPPEDYPPVFVAAPLGPDPSAPPDSYPDRMVECKLIPDERGRFVGVDEAEPASQSQAVIASALEGTRLFLRRRILKEMYSKDQNVYICNECGQCFSSKPGCKYHMQSNVCLQKSKTAKEESRERLQSIENHSKRLLQQMATPVKKRAFKRKRDKSVANVSVYPQVWLSLAFKLLPRSSNTSRAGTISAFKEESEPEDADEYAGAVVPRAKRYKRSDSDASHALEHTSGAALDSTLLEETIGSGEEDRPDEIVGSGTVEKSARVTKRGLLKKEKKPKKEDDVDFENPALVLEQLQRELIFERSRFLGPIYPSLFKALKFRKPRPKKVARRSKKHASKRKRQIRMAEKIAAAEDRRKQQEAEARKKAAEAEARRKQEEAEARRKQEEAEAERKAAEEEARRKQEEEEARRRRQEMEAEKKSRETNLLLPIIDTRALVSEVEAGRYPSIKRYKGDHHDKCYICKKGEELVCCDFCSKAVHFSCMLQRFTVREPEPGDDFMCNHCIQTLQARRNRAEKRRVKKHGEEMRKSEEAAALKTRLAGELVDTMEYESLAEQGQRASEITELLQDTQKRLEQCLNTAKLNNRRRSMIESSEDW